MNYRQILQQYWGYDDFRGVQREIIESIGSGHDTLGLMPTGGGKSVTFQVPALAMEGICLVISPLIALMKDQVEHLRRQGIKAAFIHGRMTHDEVITTLENCIFGNYKFLYVSPERLESGLFMAKLSHMNVSFVTVDEAHCISQWGYDFRPSYLRIADIREIVPHAPILALTATATKAVTKDIQRQLHFAKECVVGMSFARENLSYSVQALSGQTREMAVAHILDHIPGCSIVYTRSRAETRELAMQLSALGIAATYYHAGLDHQVKTDNQTAWQEGRYRVMVATNAFGMGIDKADVRSVIHVEAPDSPEAYFQEAGRAGRDGLPAYAVLLYGDMTIPTLKRRVEDTFPPVEEIRQIYDEMCCYLQLAVGDGFGVTREFSVEDFCCKFHHFPVCTYHALQLLSRAGYILWRDAEDGRSRVMMTTQRDHIYALHLSPAAERIIYVILRTCTGVFSEYVYIDEGDMARQLDIPEEDLQEMLVELSQSHVLSYIPRKFIPHITFRQRRLETDEITFAPDIYHDRKKELQHRIDTMIGYLQTAECRSTYLLAYFGEETKTSCGICDNCVQGLSALNESTPPYAKALNAETFAALRRHVLDYLKEHGPSPIGLLRTDGITQSHLSTTLHRMAQEDEVVIDTLGVVHART